MEEQEDTEEVLEFRSMISKFAYSNETRHCITSSKPIKHKNTEGYIYLITNPSFPGMCKIGKTTRSVSDRLKDLYNESILYPFNVIFSKKVRNCHAAEKLAHARCRHLRVARNREYFTYNQELRTMYQRLFDELE